MRPFLLHQAVLHAVRRQPRRPALRWQDDTGRGIWSYAELESASRAGAHALLGAGLQPGDRVGVWMRKSPPAVAALLAALRAGGVYVPLDPTAPPDRVARLAADCGLRRLFADADLAAAASSWPEPPLTLSPPQPGPGGDPLPRPPTVSEDLAYILYTSGSTGVPKGVMLTHAHALHFIAWAGTEVRLGSRDRVVSHAPFHFDLSIFDLWASLSRGAEVLLLDNVTSRFPRAVADWLITERPTVWYSVPSALVQLLPLAEEIAATCALRAVLFAGEVFPAPALEAWRTRLPQAEFHNWYGPTETNVCTAYRLPPFPSPLPQPLPIGGVCANFAAEIRGEDGEPSAAGEAGMLWVRGEGVFAGYWGDAARTAAVTAWRDAVGGVRQRWYNTGDRVRRGANGAFYFEGRSDDVVKCRGYRVSLLEVATALEHCPGVAQAAVVAVDASGAGMASASSSPATGLRGFVRPAAEAVLDPVALRGLLLHTLPAYMVPEHIEVRATLPLTSSGKVDRQRLAGEVRGEALRAEASGSA